MNDKLGFVTEKISDADTYLEGVHTQIDSVQVFHDLLVSDGIKNTKSHPSVTAFKSDRAETKYDNYDFINKSIELTPQSNLLKITGEGGISDENKLHSFIFNMDDKEYIKIIEFSLTYKQTPNIITISKGENDTKVANRTSTVSVNRIISGRFFLIRHDPINNPSDFIIKAIVENSDNTGNIIDRKILDVKEYVENQKLTYIFDDGPQFDMYFKIDDNTETGLKVCIGKIVPYRYVMEKKYLDFATGEESTNFNLFDSTYGINGQDIRSHNIEEIYYSKNLNATIVVDKTNKKISYNIGGNKLDSRTLSSINDFNYTAGDTIHEFWVKDAGNYVFIRIKDDHQDTTYVGAGSISALVNLNVPIYDAKKLSSGEIVVLRSNWLYFNTANNTISTDIFVNIDDVGTQNFEKISDIVEIDDKRAVVFITAEDGVYYKIKEKNTTTGIYASTTGESYKYKLTTEGFDNRITAINATSSELNVCKMISGIYVSVKLSNASNHIELVYHVNKLTKTGISYDFEVQTILQELNLSTQVTSNYEHGIKKIISTSLLDFIISEDDKLYVIDEERIVKAISFKYVENAGYTDKDSVLYMNPENNQDEYYLVDNAYLQNVQDVVETPNGIYIIDKYGIYNLESTKNLKCVLNVDTNCRIIKYLKDYNKTGTAGAAIVDSKTNATVNKIYNVYRNDYLLKDISTKKLRYNYIDLFDDKKYQLFTTADAEYEDNIPIIEFKSVLYCSFVDHLSPIYNTIATNKIVYSNDISLQSIPNAQRYTIAPNKYGFIKYDNILTLDDNKINRISDINEVKKIKIIHNATDTYTLNDALDAITEIINKCKEEIREDRVILSDYNYSAGYDLSTDEDKIFKIETQPNKYGMQIVETKYGRYAAFHNPSYCIYVFPFSSCPESHNQMSFTENLISGHENISTMFSDDELWHDFNIICLDDPLGTSFISNGIGVYKTTAWTLNSSTGKAENFKIPFSDYNYQQVFDHPNGDYPMQYIRKYDDIVYMWNESEGTIYQYNVAQDLLISTGIRCPCLLDFIKIGNDFHLFYSEYSSNPIISEYTGNTITRQRLKYKIVGFGSSTRYENFADNYLGISNFEQPYSGGTGEGDPPAIGLRNEIKVHIYNYDPQPIVYLQYLNIARNILKYDINNKVFVNSIVDDTSSYVSSGSSTKSITSLNFCKIGDTIYGSNQDLGSAGIFNKLFIYDIENDAIRNLDNPKLDAWTYATGLSSNENTTNTNYKSFLIKHDLNFNKNERFISSTNSMIKYIDGIDNITYKPEIVPNGYRCETLSEPIIREVTLNDETYNEYDLISVISDASGTLHFDSDTNIFINSYKNNEPIAINKIGKNNALKYGSNTRYIPVSESAEYDENTTYFLLDYMNTQFSPIPQIVVDAQTNGFYDVEQHRYSSQRNTRIFKYIPLDNNVYHVVNMDLIKYPVPGLDYYTLEINGEYARSTSKVFDPLKTYYLKDCKFEEYVFGNEIDTTAKYYMSCDMRFRVAERSDFDIDGINTNFKQNVQYFISEDFDDASDAKCRIDIISFPNSFKTLSGIDVHCETDLNDQTLIFACTSDYDCTDMINYNISDLSVLFNEVNNGVLSHRTLIPGIKVKTKFGVFGFFIYEFSQEGRSRRHLSCFARCSDNMRVIYDTYIIDELGSNVNWKAFKVYETSKYLFIVDTSRNKTYRYLPESLSLSEPVANMTMTHIIEYEDGSIYGKNENENALIFYKFVDSEGITPHFDTNETISYSDSIHNLKVASRYNKNGNLETYLYGTGSLHNKIYKFCQNSISPAFVNDACGYRIPSKLICANDYIYFIYSDLTEVYFYNPDTNESGWIHNFEPVDTDIQINLTNIIDTKVIENYIGNTYDAYKTHLILNSGKIFVEQIESNTEDNFKGSEFSSSVNSRLTSFCRPISNNKNFLPLIDKNNKVYYKECMADTETLEPDYSTKYKIYESDLITPINTKFTAMYMTSIGIFAFDKNDRIYLNKIYENSNGFISIGTYTQSPWVGVNRTRGNHDNPYVQETKYGIFILFGTHIFRYDENDGLVEAFAGVEYGTWTMFTNIGRYQNPPMSKYYNGSLIADQDRNVGYKLIVSKDGNNIFFGFKNSNTNKHEFYKYNHNTKLFTSVFETTGSSCIVDEISSGIYVSYGANTIRELISNTTKTISNDSNVHIYSVSENPITREVKYVDTPRIIETFKFEDDLIVEFEYAIGNVGLIQGQSTKYSFYDIIKYNEDGFVDEAASRFNQFNNIEEMLQCIYPVYKENGNVDYFYHCYNYTISNLYGVITKVNVEFDGDYYVFVNSSTYNYFSIVNNANKTFKFLKFGNVLFFNNVELFISGYKLTRDNNTASNSSLEIDSGNSGLSDTYVGYQFKFTGENETVWNNDLEDTSLTTKNKFITSCIGLMNLETGEVVEAYHDMNNYTGEQESISDVKSFYKEVYLTNNCKRKHNMLFNSINSSKIAIMNDFPIVDTSIFDNQNFTIDLIVYPSEVFKKEEIKLVRPYNVSKPLLPAHKSYLPYDPYYE
jgi:hypothetical protein